MDINWVIELVNKEKKVMFIGLNCLTVLVKLANGSALLYYSTTVFA